MPDDGERNRLEQAGLDQRQVRWRKEVAFFDQRAAASEQRAEPIHPRTLKRYSSRLHRSFFKDYRLLLLGEPSGKHILDAGCGDGVNSVLLAALGAQVTGIDISPQSIAAAERYADASGVRDRCRFLCGPVETVELAPDSFDVIWCDAILHHVIADLPLVMQKLCEYAKPAAQMILGEPVNFNRTLRRLRMMLPIHTDATPDERPLERSEVDVIRRYVPDLMVRQFSLFSRLGRFVLPDMNYERSPAVRRAIFHSLCLTDYAILSVPGLSQLGGNAVLFGHPKKS